MTGSFGTGQVAHEQNSTQVASQAGEEISVRGEKQVHGETARVSGENINDYETPFPNGSPVNIKE